MDNKDDWVGTFEQIEQNICVSADDKATFDQDGYMPCGCRPSRDGEITCLDDRCINFATQTECLKCSPSCGNNRFQRRKFKQLIVKPTPGKGRGIFANEDIFKGELIIEYVGEVISAKELPVRMERMNQRGEKHLYVMQLKAKTFVDSRYKGCISRFMNHSCEPNIRLEIWTVKNKLRLGIVAQQDMPMSTEITADYQWQPSSREPTKCHCRTPSCRGFLEIFNSEDEKVFHNRSGTWRNGLMKEIRQNNDSIGESGASINIENIFDSKGKIVSSKIEGKSVKLFDAESQQYLSAKILDYSEESKSYRCFNISNKTTFYENLDSLTDEWYWLDESAIFNIKKKVSQKPTNFSFSIFPLFV